MLDIQKILKIVRRYAEAIANGKIEAKDIATMSDDELIAFDQGAFDALEAKQDEAESLANEPVPPDFNS